MDARTPTCYGQGMSLPPSRLRVATQAWRADLERRKYACCECWQTVRKTVISFSEGGHSRKERTSRRTGICCSLLQVSNHFLQAPFLLFTKTLDQNLSKRYLQRRKDHLRKFRRPYNHAQNPTVALTFPVRLTPKS